MIKSKLSSKSLVPILISVSIALAFAVGILWQKFRSLENMTYGVVVGREGDAINNQLPQKAKEAADKVISINDTDHVFGERDARIVLIEYSDFECPFCSKFHPTVKRVVEEYGGEVMWVYRHFPLDSLHVNARSTAEASECIAELGGEDAFWNFTEEIFSDQKGNLGNLEPLVGKLGIDLDKYKTCIDNGKYAERVESEYQNGITAGVTGTPGNILLDTKTGKTILIPGALPFEQIKSSIDSLLAD